jgi:hypothetical protein
MTHRLIFSIIFGTTILGCNSSNNQDTSSDKPQKTKPILDTIDKSRAIGIDKSGKDVYSFIVRVIEKGDSSFIDADYIQYFTGQAAIDAAISAHQADTFKTEDGKTHVDVPNDYFIVNESNRIRRLALDKNCSFDLIINPDRNPPITDNTLGSLKKVHKDAPFLLTLNNDGAITKIKEIFIP